MKMPPCGKIFRRAALLSIVSACRDAVGRNKFSVYVGAEGQRSGRGSARIQEIGIGTVVFSRLNIPERNVLHTAAGHGNGRPDIGRAAVTAADPEVDTHIRVLVQRCQAGRLTVNIIIEGNDLYLPRKQFLVHFLSTGVLLRHQFADVLAAGFILRIQICLYVSKLGLLQLFRCLFIVSASRKRFNCLLKGIFFQAFAAELVGTLQKLLLCVRVTFRQPEIYRAAVSNCPASMFRQPS